MQLLFVRALDAIFGLTIAGKHFDDFVDTPRRISADPRLENHSIPDVEFVRWHRFPLSSGGNRSRQWKYDVTIRHFVVIDSRPLQQSKTG